MARPTDDPAIWSSDVNFPAGADSWNATPTKVDPGAAQVAAGHEPEDMPPAQWLNWLLNNHGQWLEYVKDTPTLAPFSNFRFVDPSDVSSSNVVSWVYRPTVFPGHTLFGTGSAVDGMAITPSKFDDDWIGAYGAVTMTDVVNLGRPAEILDPLHANYGRLVAAGTFTDAFIEYSDDGGLNWSQGFTLVVAGGDTIELVTWDETNGLFIAVGEDKIYTSPQGTAWTSRTVPAAVAGVNPGSIATNDAGVTLIGYDNELIVRTADGVAYAQEYDFALGGGTDDVIVNGLVWDSANEAFVAAGYRITAQTNQTAILDANGQNGSHTDHGAAFTDVAFKAWTSMDTDGAGLIFRGHGDTTASGSPYYSRDGGATWNEYQTLGLRASLVCYGDGKWVLCGRPDTSGLWHSDRPAGYITPGNAVP